MKDSFPPVQSLLSPERCVILERTDKQEAIGELVATLWRSVPTLDYSSIFGAIWDREIQLTTRISPEIAMPHAQIAGMTESYICLGLNPTGIAYDPKEEALVRLLVMLVGPPAEHLKILSTLARLLENEERLQALLSAEDAIQLYTAFKMTSSSAVSDVAEQADPLNSRQELEPLSAKESTLSPEEAPRETSKKADRQEHREAAPPAEQTPYIPDSQGTPGTAHPTGPHSHNNHPGSPTGTNHPRGIPPTPDTTRTDSSPGPDKGFNSQDRLLLDSGLHIAQTLNAQVLFVHLHPRLRENSIIRWFSHMQTMDYQRSRDVRDLDWLEHPLADPGPARKPWLSATQQDSRPSPEYSETAQGKSPASVPQGDSPHSPHSIQATEASQSHTEPPPAPHHQSLHLILVKSGSDDSDLTSETPNPQVHRMNTPYRRGGSRANPVNLSILLGLSRGLIKKGQKILSVFSAGDEHLDSLEVSDIDRDFGVFFSMPFHGASQDTQMEVFMRVLQIATELAAEGREGKPVGTVFLLGDAQGTKPYCQQMVVNPFRGYDESERNILDPGLTETMKEFSRIDGAIVIRGDGVIISAGTYLRIDRPVHDLPAGLGARHTAAAGITAMSKAISIAISESTRQVSIFYGGDRVMVI